MKYNRTSPKDKEKRQENFLLLTVLLMGARVRAEYKGGSSQMSRREKFARKYGNDAGRVLSSIASVARAGRSRDRAKIAAARAEHYALMASL